MKKSRRMTHWTAVDTASFQHFVAFDFLDQIEEKLDESQMSRTDLAKRLGVNKSRVSQIFSNPGNLTLRNMIEWARAVNLKLGILAYDDGDTAGERGPVSSWIFLNCWDRMRKPRDMADVGAITGCFGSGQYKGRKISPCQGQDESSEEITWGSMVKESADFIYETTDTESKAVNW